MESLNVDGNTIEFENFWEQKNAQLWKIKQVMYLSENFYSDPHFRGEGGTIYSTGFFVQKVLAIDKLIVEICEWYH